MLIRKSQKTNAIHGSRQLTDTGRRIMNLTENYDNHGLIFQLSHLEYQSRSKATPIRIQIDRLPQGNLGSRTIARRIFN